MTKKRIASLHIASVLLLVLSLCFTWFIFRDSLLRLWHGLKDFGISCAFFFCEMFTIPHSIVPTVNSVPPLWSGEAPQLIPVDWNNFAIKAGAYFKLLVNGSNIVDYFGSMGMGAFSFFKIAIIVIPFIILGVVLLRRAFNITNNDYNQDTKPLKLWKAFEDRLCLPLVAWLKGLCSFIKEHKSYWGTYLLVWLVNFRVFTIILELLAFYFYFITTFDVLNIYTQVRKLLIDLSVSMTFIPVLVWFVIAVVLFHSMRKGIAMDLLQRLEAMDKQFIKTMPIVSMIVGTMGKKKTTLLTDMALSQDVIFRDEAYKIILNCDMKFSNFPWINFENELRHKMERGYIFNLASCRQYVEDVQERFASVFHSRVKGGIRTRAEHFLTLNESALCFYYDYLKQGLMYDDKLKVQSLFDVLKTYAQAYFIYVIQSSLLISNYAIRQDMVLQDLGNFPLWNADFFNRDSKMIDSMSRHSHILDFDVLRLGKKLVDDNTLNSWFEFGVVVITEGGKERGNQVTNKGIKVDSEIANQTNDGFNSWLKMARHSATVDNYPFIKVLLDEQRPESLGADVRELCEIIHIAEADNLNMPLWLFTYDELVHDIVFGWFKGVYKKHRYMRGDNTLFIYLAKKLASCIHSYYTRSYNLYGYFRCIVQTENGTMDSGKESHNYFACCKKIWSKRFSTDCFSDYFSERVMQSKVGLDDILEYATERATFEEMIMQNSFFINDLLNPSWRSELLEILEQSRKETAESPAKAIEGKKKKSR